MDARLGCDTVTLCVDSWTNVRHHKMFNLVCVANGEAYFRGSAEVDHNDHQTLFAAIKDEKAALEAA